MSRARSQFSAVKTEGGLLPQDLLARIQAGDPKLDGTKGETYHLGAHERIGEAANRSWSRLLAAWNAFHVALEKEPETGLTTGVTRDRWLLPLFQELGYGRLPRGRAITVDGKTFAVSHTWHHSPVHLLGSRVDLDQRQKGVAGAASSSPHGLVQDFLNRSDDHLWGFVSNGYRLRVLRDHHSLTRQAYVEFDLQAIMDGEQYSEFLLLWLVCHQSRVETDKPEECWLEKWVHTSREEGVRALDKLRDGVEKAIEALGTGFLKHRANTMLREALEKGGQEQGGLDKQDYYRQILRLVYRLIFIFVAEEREALLDPAASEDARARYDRFYSTRRIRDLSEKRRGGPHGDLWRGLALVMSKLDDGEPALALPALGSLLWGPSACPWLMDAECSNEHVLDAFRQLSHIQEGKTRYPVNWRNVGADELGSIYEGLLELHPRLNKEAGTFELDTAAGHERKTTGSYYTPTSLVDCLLDSALDPVLDEAAKKGEDAILALKVCDPACGSGHFLVAAARRIAKRLASVRSGDDEPSPRDVQRALRDVVGRCVYGVDVNPMAVELCKVSLWMEAIEPGRPLSFLDSHIQCGNALLGTTPALMARGIPDDAFKPIEGDDREVAKRLKKRNRQERKTLQEQLPFMRAEDKQVFDEFVECDQGPDFDLESVRAQENCWVNLSRSRVFRDAKFLADAWCAAFVWPKQPGEEEGAAITQALWRRLQRDATSSSRATRRIVRELAQRYQFFHWHLAFPSVFGATPGLQTDGAESAPSAGFDLLIGNPPWERVNINQKEWFAARHPPVAAARNAAARRAAIARLEVEEPAIFHEWGAASRHAAGVSHLVRASQRYPDCGRGLVNTYSIFAECGCELVSRLGSVGLILPSGIATDDTTKHFFRRLLRDGRLRSLYEFENVGFFSAGKGHMLRFALTTIVGAERAVEAADCLFQGQGIADLQDPERRITLTEERIARINPNSGTSPIFRWRRDADISDRVYSAVPILLPDNGNSPWGIRLKRMFHMSEDSGQFKTVDELSGGGYSLEGNSFVRGNEVMMPLIEPKMVYHFDHRKCDYSQQPPGARPHRLPDLPLSKKVDPSFQPIPFYWVPATAVEEYLESNNWDCGWIMGWREVTDARASVRSVIVAVLPPTAVNHKFPLIFCAHTHMAHCLDAVFCSFALDYCARQKIGGLSLTYEILKQLPVPSPDAFNAPCPWQDAVSLADWMKSRVLELVYTSWELRMFAKGVGYTGPPFVWNSKRRDLIRSELDAAIFHVYGFVRADVSYVMDTFPVVRRYDERAHGDFRTKLLILDAFSRMQQATDRGMPYQALVDPPPAHPSLTHSESTRPAWAKSDG